MARYQIVLRPGAVDVARLLYVARENGTEIPATVADTVEECKQLLGLWINRQQPEVIEEVEL